MGFKDENEFLNSARGGGILILLKKERQSQIKKE